MLVLYPYFNPLSFCLYKEKKKKKNVNFPLTFPTATRRLQLLREVYHALPIFAELHDERHGQILNNQFVPKCLGLQAALGFKSLYQPRELSASIAWLALTLRQITIIFSVVFKWFNYKKDVEFYEESESH